MLFHGVNVLTSKLSAPSSHSLLTQAFEKTDVLQQDHFTELFASYSLFDMASGEARRNGKTQLNILTYSASIGKQETPS